MKHILLSIFLLLSGSVWGQEYDTNITPEMGVSIVDSPSVLSTDTIFPTYKYFYYDKPSIYTDSLTIAQIRDLIRSEIERWWEDRAGLKNAVDTSTGGFGKITAHIDPPTFSICPQSVICDKCGGEDFIFCCREDILHKCKPEPLKMVIDTVRVDTVVDYEIREVRVSCCPPDAQGCAFTLMGCLDDPYCNYCTVHNRLEKKPYPIYKITAVTRVLYDLTPEQIERLK